ncbi:hypothetical protein SO802_013960 [Lithocarpus litseifolius]|uniref:Protein kinase domain-containing protein n=1 Tax=Lithocarpus litseifolius TaxID=425828 RepID=A0AAW2D9V2_9ROSI
MMGFSFTKLFSWPFVMEIRILMVGLHALGKTTILYKLKLGEIGTTLPTIVAKDGFERFILFLFDTMLHMHPFPSLVDFNQFLGAIARMKHYSMIFRAMSYIHRCIGVCHQDIKPQNPLVNPLTHQVKLCDFGSVKVLVKGEPNISYICSRYYRAPELVFGATEYTTAIDIWSAGCVLTVLLLGQPLFPGESGVDQLVEIIKVLGTPTREEIKYMNPNYTEFKFPQIKAHPWHKLVALIHPFFDELRDPNSRLPNGQFLPALFNFKSHGMISF